MTESHERADRRRLARRIDRLSAEISRRLELAGVTHQIVVRPAPAFPDRTDVLVELATGSGVAVMCAVRDERTLVLADSGEEYDLPWRALPAYVRDLVLFHRPPRQKRRA
ncbi:hypothetical protein SAMN05421678_10233 [Actinopolymorpha cephalotaxi]|uniref:Uncharacterized protein n=1 Tax=Actinopolymorpha cephalotaxi TaxID=504797 RepID=A0A1I2LAS6_9ACTN|nr:hypothetical protein [Actinopolymorpha cephalotaxi]NYH84996.1 hypothetical protein [Actinopolymorpha cephalotaxi]SFF76083.1 hypothetical protein SAMN05421678_10233 [Actinopolymorpha cephalotaxi]